MSKLANLPEHVLIDVLEKLDPVSLDSACKTNDKIGKICHENKGLKNKLKSLEIIKNRLVELQTNLLEQVVAEDDLVAIEYMAKNTPVTVSNYNKMAKIFSDLYRDMEEDCDNFDKLDILTKYYLDDIQLTDTIRQYIYSYIDGDIEFEDDTCIIKIIKHLLTVYPSMFKNEDSMISEAIKARNLHFVEYLLTLFPDYTNDTGVYESIDASNSEMLQFFISRGGNSNTNIQYSDNEFGEIQISPLHFAVKKGDLEIIQVLLDADADVHFQDDVVLEETEEGEILDLLNDYA